MFEQIEHPVLKSIGFSMASHEKFKLAEILDRQKEVTDKISTQVRTVSVGLILFSWSVLSSPEHSKLDELAKNLSGVIGLVAALAISALIVDYLQYVLAMQVVSLTLNDLEGQKAQSYEYPTEKLIYRGQYWCFWTKQFLCACSVVLALVGILVQFVFLS